MNILSSTYGCELVTVCVPIGRYVALSIEYWTSTCFESVELFVIVNLDVLVEIAPFGVHVLLVVADKLSSIQFTVAVLVTKLSFELVKSPWTVDVLYFQLIYCPEDKFT